MAKLKYQRAVLKLSGEMMLGDLDYGVDIPTMEKYAGEILAAQKDGLQICVEMGGGNIYRWRDAQKSVVRITADTMGMLGSLMNALNFHDVLEQNGSAQVFASMSIPSVADLFTPRKATRALEEGQVVVIGGGTGQPFFTTDSSAVLHAVLVGADIVLKGTDVDGVYAEDPDENPQAELFSELSYDEVLEKNLRVMDMSAFALARDNQLPIRVFNATKPGAIVRALSGENLGTLVH